MSEKKKLLQFAFNKMYCFLCTSDKLRISKNNIDIMWMSSIVIPALV